MKGCFLEDCVALPSQNGQIYLYPPTVPASNLRRGKVIVGGNRESLLVNSTCDIKLLLRACTVGLGVNLTFGCVKIFALDFKNFSESLLFKFVRAGKGVNRSV